MKKTIVVVMVLCLLVSSVFALTAEEERKLELDRQAKASSFGIPKYGTFAGMSSNHDGWGFGTYLPYMAKDTSRIYYTNSYMQELKSIKFHADDVQAGGMFHFKKARDISSKGLIVYYELEGTEMPGIERYELRWMIKRSEFNDYQNLDFILTTSDGSKVKLPHRQQFCSGSVCYFLTDMTELGDVQVRVSP